MKIVQPILDWMIFLDKYGVSSKDEWFLTGGFPDASGGGILASSYSFERLADVKAEAMKLGFRDCKIVEWTDFYVGENENKEGVR